MAVSKHGGCGYYVLHLPESKFEDMVTFSKRAVIFPAAHWEVFEILAGMQLSTLSRGLTEPSGCSPSAGQGTRDAGSVLAIAMWSERCSTVP